MRTNQSFQTKRKKRGFTLVELVVALAVFGILTALAVSIMMLVNKTNEQTSMDTATQRNVVELQQLFSRWFNAYETADFELEVNGSVCVFRNGEEAYEFGFNSDTKRLTVNNPSASTARTLKKIDSVGFELLDGGRMIRCSLIYTDNQGVENTYGFLMFRKTDPTKTDTEDATQ